MPCNIRPTTRECVHLDTRGYFRSRDKDGGHTIWSVVSKKNSCYTQIWWLCVLQKLSYGRSKFHIGRIGFFLLFCSCDLDLDPMTFIYELDPYSLEIHRMCKYELPTSSCRLTYIHTYTQTCRQTDTTEIIYHAALRMVKSQHFLY